MIEFMKEAFYQMQEEYHKILRIMYPARGSTGFTEQNMVHIFVNCLLAEIRKKDSNAVSWLEFPWEESGKKHIDAIIYSKRYDSVI